VFMLFIQQQSPLFDHFCVVSMVNILLYKIQPDMLRSSNKMRF